CGERRDGSSRERLESRDISGSPIHIGPPPRGRIHCAPAAQLHEERRPSRRSASRRAGACEVVPMLSPAPTDQDVALSPEWLSMVLGRPGAPVKVTGVKVVETLKTMASKIRFEAECDGLAKPRTLCVKGFFDPEMARSAGVNSRSEARFYMEIAPRVDVHVPDCVYAGIDEATGHGIILMEDVVAQGGRFLTALEPYTPDQAHGSLEQLAKLHA